MLKKIGTDEIRKKMGEILDCVNLRGDESLTKLEALTKMEKGYVLEQISSASINIPQAEVDALIHEAKHLSRKTKHPLRKKNS